MAETLASIALNCAVQLDRADEAGATIVELSSEIKSEVKAAVTHFSRMRWHLTEWRQFELTTVVDQVWYSAVDLTNGDGDQDAGTRTALDVNDILSIDYLRKNTTGGTLEWQLEHIPYRRLESYREGTASGGLPQYFTRYAGQIGLWPQPAEAYTIYGSGVVKPIVPANDSDTSVFFDQAQELIEARACRMVLQKYLGGDRERMAEFQGIEREAHDALTHEKRVKTASGRLRAHG